MREWSPHSFEKVSILADYLRQFARASQGAINRVYIDAFAGDTVNVLKGLGQQFPGSAEVALGVTPAFTHVRLFEKNAGRARSLADLRPVDGVGTFEVVSGDCNVEMARVLAGLPEQAPTFAFLDPDGIQLQWSTIREIADHKRAYAVAKQRSKVEMWILFSSGGIVRILGSNQSHADAQGLPEKVARLYGAWGPWEEVWAARLDGRVSPGQAKQAYLFLYMERLAALGYRQLLVRHIHNSRNDLYAMVFVSDSPAGHRLMQWAQEKDRVRPQPGTLFDVRESRPAYEDLYTGWRNDFPIELPPWDEFDF